MLRKKTTKDYVKELALKYGLPKKLVHKLLLYGARNMCIMIEKGEDIRMPAFNITFKKEAFGNYIKAIRRVQENRKNNQ